MLSTSTASSRRDRSGSLRKNRTQHDPHSHHPRGGHHRSRLMHGVGIVSTGFVMDAIVDRHRSHLPNEADFAADLERLKPICRWTSGSWQFGPDHHRRWNELQNTPRDIQLLTNYLLFECKARVWSQPERRRRRPSSSRSSESNPPNRLHKWRPICVTVHLRLSSSTPQ